MDALKELQLNRIARTQHLQKGENTFGFGVMQEEDIEKAHQVGEVKVGKDGIKRVWTQLSNGKFDWRRVKRDKAAQEEPAKKPAKTEGDGGEKHEHEYKIEDAEKYIDGTNDQPATKKVAKYILLGKSEEEIKAMMARAKVDDSVIDTVYRFGKKLASDAIDVSKKKYKQENQPKSEEREDENKLNSIKNRLIDFYKVSSNKYSDISKMEVYRTPKGNWNLRYDGHDVSTIVGDKFTDEELKMIGVLRTYDDDEDEQEKADKENGKDEREKPVEKKEEKPKEEKPKDRSNSAFSDEDVQKLKTAGYKRMSESDMAANEPEGENWVDAYFKEEKVGKDGVKATVIADLGNGTYSVHTITMDDEGKITSESEEDILSVDEHLQGKQKFEPQIPYAIKIMTNRSGDGAFEVAYGIVGRDFIKMYDGNLPKPYPSKPDYMTQSDYEKQIGKIYAGDAILHRGDKRASKTEQLENMKELYEVIARGKSEKYQQERNEKYWSTPKGQKRKAEIDKRFEELTEQRDDINDAVLEVVWNSIFGSDDTYDDLYDKWEPQVEASAYGSQLISFYPVGGGRRSEIEIRNESDWDIPNKRNTYLDISGLNSRHQDMEHVRETLRLAERLSQEKVMGEIERSLNAAQVKMEEISKEARSLNKELNKNY